MAQLDLNDIQGNILKGYALPAARYTFLQINDGQQGRALIGQLMDNVTTAQPWPRDAGGRVQKPPATLNIGFSHQGIVALNLPAQSIESFSPAFQQGMKARANSLGDIGASAPEKWDWDKKWKHGAQPHVWISINAGDPDAPSTDRKKHLAVLNPHYDKLDETVGNTRGGVEIVGFQDAGALGQRKEHFGFTDGISDPDIDGSGVPRRTRIGKLTPEGNWKPIAAGEFLLGHADEAQETPAAPLPSLLARNGTYMAYRKLHQNVATFRRFIEEEGAKYPGGPDLLAAKMIGRWSDGTPLALSPNEPNRELVANNEFVYGDDADGVRCPMGAHVRRMNPRDALGFEGTLVNRHRIIRRGLPYGNLTAPDEPADDNAEQGIIFIALNASLERQFEFVQREWVNYGNDFLQGNDKDPVIGAHNDHGKFVISGDPQAPATRPTWICANLPNFVETRGGEYFFLPSLTALQHIADGTVESA